MKEQRCTTVTSLFTSSHDVPQDGLMVFIIMQKLRSFLHQEEPQTTRENQVGVFCVGNPDAIYRFC